MRRWLLASALALLALHAGAAHAHHPPLSIRQVNDDGGLLTVVGTVLDESGRPIPGLGADAFELRLDGEPVPIQDVRFAADAQVGLALVMAVDVSGSMAGARLEQARAAAASFIDRLEPADQVALIAFNGEVAFFSDFTTDRAAVKAIIGRLGAAGNTALYSATIAAATKAASSSLPRRAIVLVTDGENFEPGGRTTRDQATDAARRAGVPIYAIGLGAEADRPFLDDLAAVSRGQARHAPTPGDLDRLYREASDALRGQYVIRAKPNPVRRAATHTVRLSVRLSGDAASDEFVFPGAGLALLPDPTPRPTVAPTRAPEPATPAPVATAVPTDVPRAVEEPAGSRWGGRAAPLAVGMLLAAAAAAGLWLRRRRQDDGPADAEPPFEPSSPRAPVPNPRGVATLVAAPAVLEVCGGPLIGTQVAVEAEPVTIGTAQDCAVVLPPLGDVDRRHARIWQRDGRYMLHRISRRGAIIMAGQPVQWAVLEPNDEFAIGPHRFRFQTNGAHG